MNKLTRISATVASSLALVAGFTGAASADTMGSIDNTGRNSNNTIDVKRLFKADVDNDTNVKVANVNLQLATSGDATSSYNDGRTGDATSGDATNDNSTSVAVHVDNSSSSSSALSAGSGMWQHDDVNASISDTGRNSDNTIEYESKTEVKVNNETDVHLLNANVQVAESGEASSTHNDRRTGDATSGDAMNSNETSVEVHVKN